MTEGSGVTLLQCFPNFKAPPPGNLTKDSDSVRRDEAQGSGFLASSQMMEMLRGKGPYSRYQDAGFLLGLVQAKHFA